MYLIKKISLHYLMVLLLMSYYGLNSAIEKNVKTIPAYRIQKQSASFAEAKHVQNSFLELLVERFIVAAEKALNKGDYKAAITFLDSAVVLLNKNGIPTQLKSSLMLKVKNKYNYIANIIMKDALVEPLLSLQDGLMKIDAFASRWLNIINKPIAEFIISMKDGAYQGNESLTAELEHLLSIIRSVFNEKNLRYVNDTIVKNANADLRILIQKTIFKIKNIYTKCFSIVRNINETKVEYAKTSAKMNYLIDPFISYIQKTMDLLIEFAQQEVKRNHDILLVAPIIDKNYTAIYNQSKPFINTMVQKINGQTFSPSLSLPKLQKPEL